MNETILNYPGFQSLPKGAKQMLLVSEAHFFDEAVAHPTQINIPVRAAINGGGFAVLMKKFTRCAAGSALSLRRFRPAALYPRLGSGCAG
ncbi:MAG TPA: hypothetical protein VGO67_13370 [Verrucomicrobiae bacterium]